jgi:hypothetical protein
MFEKIMKRLDVWDIALTKLAVAASVLFLINVWPAAMNWAQSIHWGWFLAVAFIAALRPWSKGLTK